MDNTRSCREDFLMRWLMIACLALCQNPVRSALADDAGVAPQFGQLRSLLSNHCFACHGPDAEKRQGGFRLDQGDSVYQAAESGKPPVISRNPSGSELFARISSTNPDERMPPAEFGKPLSSSEIELIRQWIDAGAPPLKHWSFVPPIRPSPPLLSDAELIERWPQATADMRRWWQASPIDRFVLNRQLPLRLTPTNPAPREELLRRLALDVTGLPPGLQLLDSFSADSNPDAMERVVDRLLASPKYGEHWARKWLDLARYADSAGYADDPPRTIWAYRDWVVRAVNADMPIDQFTIAQLAGDLLPNPTEDDLVATAFHRNTLTNNEGGTNDEEFRNVAVVDRVNTTMAVWMGVTFNCAQCHTHKYDPFTQTEYFKIFDIFNQSQDADRRDESPLVEIFTEEQIQKRSTWQSRIAQLREQLLLITPTVRSEFAAWANGYAEPAWQTLEPLSFRARTNTDATWDAAGRIFVKPMQDKIVADTFTLELKLPSGQGASPVQALSLRTLPRPELPGRGAGRGGGNFVLTDVRAAFIPHDATAPKARFVRLELTGKDRILSLAEVQAFSGGTNVALKAQASQSSTGHGGDATRAIDGKTNGEFEKNSTTHTETSENPWWEIDLGSSLPIDRVTIWNRTDIGVGNRLDGVKIVLMDDQRNAVHSQSITKAPKDSQTVDIVQVKPIKWKAAFADYEQSGFSARHVLDNDKASGWAVGGQLERSHWLTLLPEQPIEAGQGGSLRVELAHESSHRDHLLASFDLAISHDKSAIDWAQLSETDRLIVIKPASSRTPDEQDALTRFYARNLAPSNETARAELADLESKLALMKAETSVPIMREREKNQKRETFVQLRGNYKSLGEKVEAGVPAIFHEPESPLDRMGLAQWLMARKNPLTARVMANRLWEALFGLGIVRTSEEFGSQGDPPTHPELLDWLAVELQELQWDSKRFLRTLVLTQTYQQSSEVSPANLAADADNVWLARGPRVRLTAEMVRDQVLAAAGMLSSKMHGPPVRPPQPSMGLSAAFGSKTDWDTSVGEDRFRRGLYTTWRRSNPYPSMATFDAPSREVCTLRRDSTNTPLQALVTLNDPSFVEAAQALARRVVLSDGPSLDTRGRLQLAFRLCTSRSATDRELSAIEKLLREATSQLEGQIDEAKKLATDPIGPLPEKTNPVELAAWTALANVLLNLDEVLMKR